MSLISPSLRTAVLQRAANACEYCCLSQDYQAETFPVDHIIPVRSGGKTEIENLALSCSTCNARKWIHTSAEDPVTHEIVPLFNPRTDAWHDHFRWAADDPCRVDPLSAIGRATASLLDLNSRRRQEIRRWLIEVGAHPPVSLARK